MDHMECYLNERVVLTTKNETCYAGTPVQILTIEQRNGLLVRIDDKSGFSVWCPEEFIKEVLVIPIPKDADA